MTITMRIPYQTIDHEVFAPDVIRQAIELRGGKVIGQDDEALTVELPFDVEPTFMRTVNNNLRLIDVSLIPSKGVRP